MTVARIILGLGGVLFTSVGAYYLLFPAEGAEAVGIREISAGGLADVRAVYGGLDAAVGVFLLLSLIQGLIWLGLRVQTFAFAGLLVGRSIGFVMDSPEESLQVVLLGVEAFCLALSVAGSKRCTMAHCS